MTGHSYIAIWPIEDRDRPVSALIAEACRDLDRMAALVGAPDRRPARVVGQRGPARMPGVGPAVEPGQRT